MSLDYHTAQGDFGTIVQQLHPWVLSNFVMWLDLKVAEYKVLGKMALDEDNANDNGPAWMGQAGTMQEPWSAMRAKQPQQHGPAQTVTRHMQNNGPSGVKRPRKSPSPQSQRTLQRRKSLSPPPLPLPETEMDSKPHIDTSMIPDTSNQTVDPLAGLVELKKIGRIAKIEPVPLSTASSQFSSSSVQSPNTTIVSTSKVPIHEQDSFSQNDAQQPENSFSSPTMQLDPNIDLQPMVLKVEDDDDDLVIIEQSFNDNFTKLASSTAISEPVPLPESLVSSDGTTMYMSQSGVHTAGDKSSDRGWIQDMNFEQGNHYSNLTYNTGFSQRTIKSESENFAGFTSKAKLATPCRGLPRRGQAGIGRGRDTSERQTSETPSSNIKSTIWKTCETKSGETVKQCRCPLCNRIFDTSVELKLHMTNEHRVNPLFCEICMKAFQSKNDYVGHMNSHMNLRPYTCDRCGKSFSFKSSMNRHKSKVCNDQA